MSIQLVELEHQTKALKSISQVFKDVNLNENNPIEQNPIFDQNDLHLRNNINGIWDGNIEDVPGISRELRGRQSPEEFGIDIRMETGTGKTYTYTHMMYALNELYGFNKFVLLVPSAPIKEGTKNFIKADYSKSYFNDIFPNKNIQLNVLNAQKTKNGRKMFPTPVAEYARGNRLEKNKIQVLLMTDSMFMSKRTMEKDDYDQTLLENYTQPYQVIRETKPIVIIDEPHRFKRENKTYKKLLKELNPQAVIRFGATFPKNMKTGDIDYNNLIYNLGSAQSFNKGLVKGIAVQTLGNVQDNESKIKLTSINKGSKSINIRDEISKKVYIFKNEDDLGLANESFSGLKINKITKKIGVELSNGLVLQEGNQLYSSIFGATYQELMLKQAIENHVKFEEKLFMRNEKIKTISLFFIDNIYAYRGDKETNGYLRDRFENMLKESFEAKLNEYRSIQNPTPSQKEYVDYIEASINQISLTNGGYFSEDNDTSDVAIANEVEQILRDKESLLSFKDENGNWNIRRFIFSKWTLKEGWDNPNIFQIAKLRTSGSETSKLQEVGRGLRLPVDENGNRIDTEQFYLTYLIDFSEKDFAQNLVDEINSTTESIKAVTDMLSKVAEVYGTTEEKLFAELLIKGYVNIERQIISDKKDAFFMEYPEFDRGLLKDKVIDETSKERSVVKVNKENFSKIKSLWNKVNQKYYLALESASDDILLVALQDILMNKEIPVNASNWIHTKQSSIDINKDQTASLNEKVINSYKLSDQMSYKDFLIRLHKNTGVPMNLIHSIFIQLTKDNELVKGYFNKTTLQNIQSRFKEWFETYYASNYSYERLNISRQETKLTDINGNIKDTIVQGDVGLYRSENTTVPDNFLYETVIYDSPKELETIQNSNSDSLTDKVVVFGKIPRRSIQVPLYFGGTTSPDFMYVLEKPNGEMKLGLIIETKDIKQKSHLRGTEKSNILSAKKFFDSMKEENIEIIFKPQLKNDDIVEIISALLE